MTTWYIRGGSVRAALRSATTAPCPSSVRGRATGGGGGGGSDGMEFILSSWCPVDCHCLPYGALRTSVKRRRRGHREAAPAPEASRKPQLRPDHVAGTRGCLDTLAQGTRKSLASITRLLSG